METRAFFLPLEPVEVDLGSGLGFERVELNERVLGVFSSSSDERTMTEFRFGMLQVRFVNS